MYLKRNHAFFAMLVMLIAMLSGISLMTHTVSAALPPSDAASTTILSPNDSPECWPLDVVVLIDESLSMSKPDGNDPNGYRFIATEELLNLLISNRQTQCDKAIHRLGVIYFTDEVTDVVPLTPIDIPTQEDPENWEQYQKITQAIVTGMPRNMNNGTDPLKAFQAADAMLSQAKNLSDPVDYGHRRQVIILLTDGNPEGARIRLEPYMRDLIDYLNQSKWDDRDIWIVALNANGRPYLDQEILDGKTMGEIWQEIAESHRGKLLRSDYNEQTIPMALNAIIDEEFGQPGERIQCGDFYVAPYLQSVRFTFSKRLEERNKLIILSKLDDETGEVLYRYFGGDVEVGSPEDMNPRYRRRGIIEEYSFDFPLPGRWHFVLEGLDESECRLVVDARQTPRPAEVRLISPSDPAIPQIPDPPYYDTEVPIPFILRLEALDGRPIPLPDYPLVITATLHLPNGQTKLPDGSPIPTYIFSRTDEDLWQSDPPYILAPEEGTYILDVRGTSMLGNPPTDFAVFTETISYEVKKLGRLRFEIQTPAPDQSIPCNIIQDRKAVGRPVPVVVQLLDPTGQGADPDFYLTSDPDQSFEATFLDASGSPLDTIMLQPSSQSVGVFEGTLMESIPNVVGCGQVSVRVTFTGTVDTTRFVLPQRKQTVSFERPQSEGVLVMPTKPSEGERLRLHASFWDARHTKTAQPVDLVFTLADLSGQTLSPEEVAKGSPATLYQARLIAPDGQSEALTLTVNGPTFSASGGTTLTQEGTYIFEIAANPDNFKEGYIPGDTAPVHISFERYDTLMTKPSTFKTVRAILMALLAIMIGITIYLRTGAPVGVLEIREWGRDDNALSFGLHRGRFPTFKNKTLEAEFGIKLIRAWKAKSLEGGERAVHVKIVNIEGEEIFEGILEVDQPVPIGGVDQDIEIVYR